MRDLEYLPNNGTSLLFVAITNFAYITLHDMLPFIDRNDTGRLDIAAPFRYVPSGAKASHHSWRLSCTCLPSSVEMVYNNNMLVQLFTASSDQSISAPKSP